MKIVQITILASDEDAETIEHDHIVLATNDDSKGAWATVRDLTDEDRNVFGPVLQDLSEREQRDLGDTDEHAFKPYPGEKLTFRTLPGSPVHPDDYRY